MYLIQFDELIQAFEKRFSKKFVVLTRLHPHISKALELSNDSRVINAGSYPDIQELMIASFAGITDYSSWIYDFLLLRRPGFIFATDVQDYLSQRELYFPIDSTPFPFADTREKLYSNIVAFDEKKFITSVQHFLDQSGCMDDGSASERIANYIFEKIKR